MNLPRFSIIYPLAVRSTYIALRECAISSRADVAQRLLQRATPYGKAFKSIQQRYARLENKQE